DAEELRPHLVAGAGPERVTGERVGQPVDVTVQHSRGGHDVLRRGTGAEDREGPTPGERGALWAHGRHPPPPGPPPARGSTQPGPGDAGVPAARPTLYANVGSSRHRPVCDRYIGRRCSKNVRRPRTGPASWPGIGGNVGSGAPGRRTP